MNTPRGCMRSSSEIRSDGWWVAERLLPREIIRPHDPGNDTDYAHGPDHGFGDDHDNAGDNGSGTDCDTADDDDNAF